MDRKWSFISLAIVMTLMSSVLTFGQGKESKPERDVVFQWEQLPLKTFVISEMSFEGKVVKGAPYSAQAVTEHTYLLADGNRIYRKTSALIYRDSEGRTRREETMPAVGLYAPAEGLKTILINDPVAGVSFVLNPQSQIATKNQSWGLMRAKVPAPSFGGPPGFVPPPNTDLEVFEMKVQPPTGKRFTGAESGGIKVETPPLGDETRLFVRKGLDNLVSQSLGKQMIEGVEADGTRTTMTIPAGEIGNDRPIEIVDERWYSSELQTVVMSRHSDPLAGETVYKLTNIDRNEPVRSLFEVPAGYNLKVGPPIPITDLPFGTAIRSSAKPN